MTTTLRKLLLASSAAALTANAQAALVFYSSASQFGSSTTGAVTDTFNDLAAGTNPASGLVRSLGGGTYTASSADASVMYIGNSSFAPSGGSYLSENLTTGQPITIGSFTGALPFAALGGYFFGSNQVPVAATLTVTAFDLDGSSLTKTFNCALTTASCFMGFASNTGISKLSFSSNTSFVGLDDLIFAKNAAIPEPTSLALVGAAGLALLAAARRRRV